MTNEEAINMLHGIRADNLNLDDAYTKDKYETLGMAIKALEQQPILDKIRAEIEQGYCVVNNDYDKGRNYGLYMATQIIDKHKTESEKV